MAKREKYPSELADRFQIRLPEGLRQRIRLYSERSGRPMNTEILEVLEREFPEPFSLGEKIRQLSGILTMLRSALEVGDASPREALDDLLLDVRRMLEDIAVGRVFDVDETVRHEVSAGLSRWLEEIGEIKRYEALKPLDPERIESIKSIFPDKF